MSNLLDDLATLLFGSKGTAPKQETVKEETTMASVEELKQEIADEFDRLAVAAKDAIRAAIDAYEADRAPSAPAVTAPAPPAVVPVGGSVGGLDIVGVEVGGAETAGTEGTAEPTKETAAGADPSTVKWND